VSATRSGVAAPPIAVRLVIVDDFDIGRTLLGPGETDTPLVVDADRVLPASVSRESLEPVRRRL
jgi:hypothetical protein